MPWWKGKAHKSNRSEDSPQSVSLTGSAPFDSPRSSSSSRHSLQLAKNRPSELKSRGVGIEDSTAGVGARVGLRSPVTGNSLRFSGFDSDTGGGGVGGEGERECHPLPRPSGSNIPVHGSDHGDGAIGSGGGSGGLVGLVNGGSASVSSVSSSGSSDDPPPPLTDQFAQPGVSRRHDEVRHHIRARSAGPRSRGATTTVSPHHPRLGGGSLESLTGKAEDGRSQGHPLPLPPSSPTSSSAVHNGKASFPSEKLRYNTPSKWMKGTLLGRGTFGHVYLGFNSEKGRMCAIKEVRVVFDDQNSKECLKQLNQEINLLSQLSHPNIVQYYGSELGEERLSVYLEYVSGGSIHKLLQQYGPFKEPVIQSYTSQILSGLAYLHARNTVHRDIKGANILVDPHGEIKLADFGMAKHIANSASVLSFKGSPYWMAPEVVMNTNGYDLAVDIWSLGCTIFEMATSKPPWSQFEGVAAIFKIGNSKDIPEIPVHLSNEAKDFLRLCFQRDPSARPSAADLLNHPFVMDQTATTVSSLSLTTEAFHFTYDGSCKPKTLDIHPRRKSTSSYGAENVESSVVPVSRELWDNARTIISLPVSPSSSPLRQSNPGYRSCLPSPPHPAYPSVGQTNHPRNDFLLSPTHGQPLSYSSDNWNDRQPWSRAQTPSALLGMRLI